MTSLTWFVLAVAVLFAAPAFAQESANMTMEILKEKVKADKKLIVAANMNLTDAEAKGFWPMYESFQKAGRLRP